MLLVRCSHTSFFFLFSQRALMTKMSVRLQHVLYFIVCHRNNYDGSKAIAGLKKDRTLTLRE